MTQVEGACLRVLVPLGRNLNYCFVLSRGQAAGPWCLTNGSRQLPIQAFPFGYSSGCSLTTGSASWHSEGKAPPLHCCFVLEDAGSACRAVTVHRLECTGTTLLGEAGLHDAQAGLDPSVL